MPAGYETVCRIEDVHLGADGNFYASLWLNSVEHVIGVSTPSGHREIGDFVSLANFFEDPAEPPTREITTVVVDEDLAYVHVYPDTLRIPRAIWDLGNTQ